MLYSARTKTSGSANKTHKETIFVPLSKEGHQHIAPPPRHHLQQTHGLLTPAVSSAKEHHQTPQHTTASLQSSLHIQASCPEGQDLEELTLRNAGC